MNVTEWLERYPHVWARFVRKIRPVSVGPEVVDELLKFFALTRTTNRPLAMVNPVIDELWHTFIEFTEEYAAFCDKYYGAFIHHRPRTEQTAVPPEAVQNFYEEYRNTFASVPSIWDKDVPPELIEYGYKRVTHFPEHLAWSGWPGWPGRNDPGVTTKL